MGIRTALLSALLVTAVGPSAFAGSQFKFSKYDQRNHDRGRDSFKFNRFGNDCEDDQTRFNFKFNKHNDCDLPPINLKGLNLGKLFNQPKRDCDIELDWEKLLCKFDGRFSKHFNFNRKGNFFDCDRQRDSECDQPQGGNPGECPVVPVPAAGWAGMTLLGGLAAARKIRRRGTRRDAIID